MATAGPPREPLVAIFGTTGTGKSDLAVDLARRFNGEIINADAMQMYKGLPVITNQLPVEERRGVPHHLLATIDPREPTWDADIFAREAARLICEIRSRGKLPIVVGGTHYYIHALLFEDSILGSLYEEEASPAQPDEEHLTQFSILNAPTDLMLKRLREVDPAMADRWHPGDRRKIRRSLQIFLSTGKRASDIYAEQKQARAAPDPEKDPWQALMFWVHTDPEVLQSRLDKRVDKMIERGLIAEVRALHNSRKARSEQGEVVNLTRGIWQSIGYRQMEPFLDSEEDGASPEERTRRKEAGLERIRTGTRQYARHQLRWIRHKTINMLRDHDALDYLFLLNSSNVDSFSADVLEPAARLLRTFLSGQPLPDPAEVSSRAGEVLAAFRASSSPEQLTLKVETCNTCGVSVSSADQWQKHLKGRRHQRGIRKTKRTSLIPLAPRHTSLELYSAVSFPPDGSPDTDR
ncbi:tRNA isopentenyltransferase [Durotheca rogersii]|uniref:tRNA isopentenyltransferase n=1 Tax=Durotheca rogersii TaxID=419775 RepID=UPI00221EC1B6|nr:tRNA isopentenyltransferase [Durotheca rogersii]KAI5859458.1 tRNA isopentenyltransferase [Durotheca rogersii]